MVRRSSGFSLTELLVVAAIISILAAILMPTLEQALDASRDIACKNNMRQLGVSEGLFANDRRIYAGANTSPEHYQALAWNGYADNVWPAYPSNVASWARPRGVWLCPSVTIGSEQTNDRYLYDVDAWNYMLSKGQTGDPSWYASGYVSSYSPNIHTRTDYPRQWEEWNYGENYGAYACQKRYKISEVTQAGRVFLLTDGISKGNYMQSFAWNSTDPQNFIYARHGGHMNALYWDLHVGQAGFYDYLHNSNSADERARLKADGFPSLRAPHGKINSNGVFRPIDPSQY